MATRIRSIPMKWNYIKFGTDIRAIMLELGLSLSEVAELSGVSSATISVLATRREPNAKMNTWLAVCNALDLDPRDYFELAG